MCAEASQKLCKAWAVAAVPLLLSQVKHSACMTPSRLTFIDAVCFLLQLWSDVRVQLQDEAAASFAGGCNSGLQLEEGHGLQPRSVFVQLMTHVLQLAHAAAAAGAVPPRTCCAALRQTLDSNSRRLLPRCCRSADAGRGAMLRARVTNDVAAMMYVCYRPQSSLGCVYSRAIAAPAASG